MKRISFSTAAAFLLACSAAAAGAQDRGRIAFSSDRGGNFEIYVMNADGSSLRRLTDFKALRPQDRFIAHHAYDMNPAWSPDGKRIAFVSYSFESRVYRLYEMNDDGSDPQAVVVSTGSILEPRWSRDGRWIVFGGSIDVPGAHIYALRNKDLRWTRLTRLPWEERDAPAMGDSPDFAPDMSSIAFGCSPPLESTPDQICLMDLSGARVRQLTKPGEKDSDPRWSPDGRRLLFHHADDSIRIMNADGSQLRQIAGPYSGPANWSPDGKRIVFSHRSMKGSAWSANAQGLHLASRGEEEREAIYVMSPDGTHLLRLTTGEAVDQDPDWTR